jgi:hypothetical protein
LRRWLIAALASSALVAVAFLPPERERAPRLVLYRYEDHEEHLRDILRRFRSRLYQLELRDSLLESATGVPTEEGSLLLVQAWFPQVVEDTVRALAEEPFNALRNGSPEYRAVVALMAHDVLAPWTSPGMFGRLEYYLPTATDGEICLVTLALEREAPVTNWLRSIRSAAEDHAILGPCAYFAAFGSPGSYIEEWLESTDFLTAMYPAWAVDPEPLGPLSPEQQRFVRRYEVELYGCAAGNRQACRLGLLLAPARRYWLYAVSRWIVGARNYQFYARLGPNSGRFLSDLLVDMGEKRFARFWSSEDDLETAFAEAFGVELEDWMMRWARIQVGQVDGPVPALSSALLGLLLAGVFVGGATFLVRGRQVS